MVLKRAAQLAAAATVACTLAFASQGAGAASGPPVPPPHLASYAFVEHGSNDGHCWDMPLNSQSNGTQYQIWNCHSVVQEGFVLVTTSWQSGCTQTCDAILEQGSGKCVDLANGGSDGGKIQQWTCLQDEDQAWMPVSVNHDGRFPVYYANPRGWCIDLTNNNTANGTKIQAWGCPLDAAERWSGP